MHSEVCEIFVETGTLSNIRDNLNMSYNGCCDIQVRLILVEIWLDLIFGLMPSPKLMNAMI